MKQLILLLLSALSLLIAGEPQQPVQNIDQIRFKSIPFAKTEAEKNQLLHIEEVIINGEKQTIAFTPLMHTNYHDHNETFGQLKDYQDNPIFFKDGSRYVCNGATGGIGSSGLDFSSILHHNHKLYMISQFECPIGAMYLFELDQNHTTGVLKNKIDTLRYISQKDEPGGGYVHCAGQATPWNSHLGSEEYESDAKTVETTVDAKGFTNDPYYNKTVKFFNGNAKKQNPYFYGWVPEVRIDQEGEPHHTKHYSMGRFSHELAFVMPDRQTVYMSDDGTNVGLFMFKADRAEDLSSGQLYAAKLHQTDTKGAGAFTLEWIDLGHATDQEIRHIITSEPKFSDFFETATPQSNGCPVNFTSIHTSVGHECLRLKPDANATVASRLETRRYAALQGATTELRKEEGITYDPVRHKLYIAMSEINEGMLEQSAFDQGGNNHINLAKNDCGAVYELSLNKHYQATEMRSLLEGEMISKDLYGNRCHPDKISNPDNITMLAGTDILTIGEDSSHHPNNVVWAYDLQNRTLTRLLSAPLGAEMTSLFWYTDINGWGYLTTVTQHPNENTTNRGESTIGVLGPIRFR